MSDNNTERFIKYLRDKGYLVTRQRIEIAEVIFNTQGHLSADDIMNLLPQNEVSVSYTSIHRTLKVLVKSELVIQHHLGKRFKRFEAVRQDLRYGRLICASCGKVVEFRNDKIEELQQLVIRELEFKIITHKLEIYGRCSKCRGK